MKTLKTVVSGLGRIGWQFHLPSISGHDGFQLAAVCDPLEERLEEAQKDFSVKSVYKDFHQMISEETPDLVVIASPTHFHEEQAIHAMEEGCDVFLDKPMAPDLATADRIIEAKKRTGQKLMMYQPYRARGEMLVLRDIMDSGILGNVFMIKVRNHNFVFRNDWQAFRKYGGGMLNNFGAHAIDEALCLGGGAAKRVSGHMYKVASAGDADDVVKILIETESGITLDIEINMANAMPDAEPRVTVYGSLGTARLAEGAGPPHYIVRYYDPTKQEGIVASDFLAAADRKYITAAPSEWIERDFPLDGEAIDYYQKCYEYYALGMPPFVDLAETREVMRVMYECRKGAGWL